MEYKKPVPSQRIVYFDYLRVFATFAVIVIHVSAQNRSVIDVNTFRWQISSAYEAVTSWAVPVFVMISGALFLSRVCAVKDLYCKYILRLITAFICWSFIYAVSWGGGGRQVLLNTIKGRYYHLWFIPMMVGLYICIPILQKIVESEAVTKYFLLVSFIFTFLLPFIVRTANEFGGEGFIVEIVNAFNETKNNMHFHLALEYTFYFVTGFCLSKMELSKKSRCILYLSGMAGFASTICLSLLVSIKRQGPVGTYYGNFTINVLLESIAVFIWFKYHSPKCVKLNTLMGKLQKYSFGAYLVHVLIMENLDSRLGLNTVSLHPLVFVPVIAGIIFVVAFAVSWLIHQIPGLKKYIV